MTDVLRFLTENSTVYLATVDKLGKPKVRPFAVMLIQEGRVYFCTSNKKGAYEDLIYNQYIELAVINENNEWVRVAASIEFLDEPGIKERIVQKSGTVQKMFGSPASPDLSVFYLKQGSATLYRDYYREPQTTEFNV